MEKSLKDRVTKLSKDDSRSLPVIGWREWVAIPDLGIERIKAKVDSGARSSSLHASNIEEFDKNGERYVRFKIHPKQRKPDFFQMGEAKVIDVREVRSSSGKSSIRTVISTNIRLLDRTVAVELTLADRSEMGFRMLLGREAFRGRFIIDAGNSFYGGKPKRRKKS